MGSKKRLRDLVCRMLRRHLWGGWEWMGTPCSPWHECLICGAAKFMELSSGGKDEFGIIVNDTWEDAYHAGYNEGHADGESRGHKDGWNAGYDIGLRAGKVLGRLEREGLLVSEFKGSVIATRVEVDTSGIDRGMDVLGSDMTNYRRYRDNAMRPTVAEAMDELAETNGADEGDLDGCADR